MPATVRQTLSKIGGSVMPMELLQALADAELPLEFANPTVQLELRVLHEAGHIICSFPPDRSGEPQPARLEMVTALGHKALRHFGPNSAFGRLGAP